MKNDSLSMAGVDVGGTFTDFVALENGVLRVHKRLSTPEDQSRSIAEGLGEMELPQARVIHGSTVATNALLERRGAKAALLTTRGFADVMEIGRQNRPKLYDLAPVKIAPLIPSEVRFEVTERVGSEGEVLVALDEEEVRLAARQMRELGVESVAVVFLWSFLNPSHEERAGEILRQELGKVPITLSCELLPEYREYERTSTCAINAYVAPPVARYLGNLSGRLPEADISILASDGGALNIEAASQEAARLVLSGPAGGIVGALRVGEDAGETRLLTFDMGGTSTDVALCDGTLPQSSEGSIAGLPLRLPCLDIHTVGAGGGSIARVESGVLQVGPHSAGSMPGPACYGRGGTLPTVSDANLVLGRLDAAHFLGGAQVLDEAAARAAIEPLAEELGLSVERTALGIIRVANASMERALRRVSVERGIDPRQFALFPFGGAGPLHACDLAKSLGIKRILVAPHPGVLSALGMLVADETRETSRAVLAPLSSLTMHEVLAALKEMQGQIHLVGEVGASLELRYRGQSHEIAVPLSLEDGGLEAADADFHEAHRSRYGYAHLEREIEAVTLRVRVVKKGVEWEMPVEPLKDKVAQASARKVVWFESGDVEVPCYERTELQAGARFEGPAIVWQFDATTVVGVGWKARVDERGNLWLERG